MSVAHSQSTNQPTKAVTIKRQLKWLTKKVIKCLTKKLAYSCDFFIYLFLENLLLKEYTLKE